MKCENCGKEIDHIITSYFDPFDEFMKDIMNSWNKSQEEKNILSNGGENTYVGYKYSMGYRY